MVAPKGPAKINTRTPVRPTAPIKKGWGGATRWR